MPSYWIVSTPSAPHPETRRIRTPLHWSVTIRTYLRDAYGQSFRSVNASQLAALEAHALNEGQAGAELDCVLRNGKPFRVTLQLQDPDRFPSELPADDTVHRPKMWRLSFDNTRPPRVAYIRSPQNMADEIRKTAYFAHKLTATTTHGPRYADVLRRASAEHTVRVTFTCEAQDGSRCSIPITLTDEDASPLDVASLL